MRLWPFDREQRSQPAGADYTQTLLAILQSRAEGVAVDPNATAALEAAAGLLARAFAMARVEPRNARTMALTPPVLASVGRELVRQGECLFRLNVSQGRVQAVHVSHWDVYGTSEDPMGWSYRADLPSPDLTRTVVLPAAAVLHPRYAVDPREPWRGVGPLGYATATARLSGGLEHALAGEAEGPYGHALPKPDQGADTTALAADLKTLRGGVRFVDTMAAGWGEGMAAAPRQDWKQARIGIDPSAASVSLRSDAALAVLAACGVPSPLVGPGEGTAAREAWRRFLHSTAQPLADAFAVEAAAKLGEPSLTLSFNRLFASDLSGRARAFQSMVGAGMETDKAAALAGLMEAEG